MKKFWLFLTIIMLQGSCFGELSTNFEPEKITEQMSVKKDLIQGIPKTQTISVATTQQKPTSVQSTQVQIQPQMISFELCNKIFKIDNKKLFYLTLASLNANRFIIDEIQSKGGYVMFTANRQQFLAAVINIDNKSSMLKVTPCNNSYFFPSGIVQNIYKYIELNLDTKIELFI